MSYTGARDKHTAVTFEDASHLMCIAHGCPNIWTIQSSKLCRWHSAAEPHDWPRVTEEVQHAATERVIEKARPALEVPPLTRGEKTAILQRLRATLARQKLAP